MKPGLKGLLRDDLIPQEFTMTDIMATLAQKITSDLLKDPKRKLRPDEALISSGLIDSMSLVDLAILVEDTFGVHIDDTELNAETFDTLDQLTALIQARQ
jgi:acyl carrier protein